MNKEQAKAFAKLVCEKVPADQPRTGWIVATCPLGPWTHPHGSKSPHFAIKIEHGDSLCNCFVCDKASGPASAVVTAMAALNKANPKRHVPYAEALQLIADAEAGIDIPNLHGPSLEDTYFAEEPPGLHLFPDWWLETFPSWRSAPEAVAYLAGRDAPPAICDALDLRYDSAKRRVCVPVRDRDSVLRGLHGRAIDADDDPKYRMYPQAHRTNPDVWLGEHWIDTNRPVVLVEGYFDLISVMRVYRNVASPLFPGANAAKMARMSDAWHLVTLYDPDTAGDKGRAKVDLHLPKQIRTHLKLPPKRDPGSLSIPELRAILGPHLDLDETIDW